MATDYNASLSYPNPSLGEMGGLEDRRTSDGSASKRPDMSGYEAVTGNRRIILIVSLLTGLLFSCLDTSIVSTSLVTISHELDDFVNAPWVVLAYLLTYMGFAVSIAKLSDIYGRRSVLAVSWVIFLGFSLGCANSKDMISLIVCRAFQGIGASGLYSLTQISLLEIGPVNRPGLIGAMIGTTLAIAFVLGPLIGGVVSQLSDWRWLFNMNIPVGLLAILAITNMWPQEQAEDLFSRNALAKIDFLGSSTLLFSSGLLVFGIQQAGSRTLEWGSAPVISSLVIAGLSWAVFVGWEILLETKKNSIVEPVFPIRLMLRRGYSAALITTLLTGFPYIALSIVVPERYQIVKSQNAMMAGVHLLPLLGACAFGSFLGGAVSSKRNYTSYTLIAASSLQLLGLGLMTTISDPNVKEGFQYLFQALFGMGVGLGFSAATISTNILTSEENERASAQGAVAQARVLGGCIGLSVCTVIFNNHVDKYLEDHLTPEQLETLLRSPLSGLQMSHDVRELIKEVYTGAFVQELQVMVVICAVMVIVSLWTLERHAESMASIHAVQEIKQPLSRRTSGSNVELGELANARQGV